MMQPFVTHTGRVACLDRANVDTDQIIPKQFLKRVERSGYGAFLFHAWRHGPDGALNPEFELNQANASGASILVTGANFGCGSSREHAAWSLRDYGFRTIIAPSFADIFRDNAVENGIVPAQVDPDAHAALIAVCARPDPTVLTVDLEDERITGEGLDEVFSIDRFHRKRLLEGLDRIALTLRHESAIARWETLHAQPR
jgi:3-isopropylmalate/(R)-2-methylmalate dehydratase small subunit